MSQWARLTPRLAVALLAPLLLSLAPAAAQAPSLAGWWRGQIEQGVDRTDFYLHLGEGERPRARFSVPAARMNDGDIGPYHIDGGELSIPGVGWQLALAEDGQSLDGLLPPALVPHYQIRLSLQRTSTPPPAPPEIIAEGPAPAPVWTSQVGAEVWAGIVHDPRRRLLFVAGDGGRVTALLIRNGNIAWSRELGAPIRATPTLADDRLYIATDAELAALNPGSGRILWRTGLGAQLSPRLPASDPNSQYDHYSASAVVQDGLAVVPARDGCVHAFRASSGHPVWRQCLGALITSTPAVVAGKVFVGAFDGFAYALSLGDGRILWRHDTHGAIPRDAVASGANILFGSRSYDLVALDRETGQPAWTRYFWFSWVDSVPFPADGAVYIGSSDLLAVQALDSASGSRLWSAAVPGWSWARPAVGEASVYAGIIGNSAYFQPRSPGLAAIDRASGRLRWLFRPQERAPGLSGFASSPIVVGDRIFAADLAGKVYAFEDPQTR